MKGIWKMRAGAFVSLSKARDIVGELLVLSFGREWREQIERAYDRYLDRGTWRDRLIRRKIESGEIDWLLGKLRSRPLYPGLVQALGTLDDPRIAPRLLTIAADADLPSENRWAIRFLHLRLTGRNLAPSRATEPPGDGVSAMPPRAPGAPR
jgi:hypothetical protein